MYKALPRLVLLAGIAVSSTLGIGVGTANAAGISAIAYDSVNACYFSANFNNDSGPGALASNVRGAAQSAPSCSAKYGSGVVLTQITCNDAYGYTTSSAVRTGGSNGASTYISTTEKTLSCTARFRFSANGLQGTYGTEKTLGWSKYGGFSQ